MSRDLLLRLVLPLGLLAILGLILSTLFNIPFDTSGFLINLSTDFLMIIITILYVDWVLRTSESKRWLLVDKQINSRIRTIVYDCLFSTFKSLGIFDQVKGVMTINQQDIQLYLDNSKQIITDESLLHKLMGREDYLWDFVINDMTIVRRDILQLLDMFGNKISPSQIDLLLSIEMRMYHIINDREVYTVLKENYNDDPEGQVSWEFQWSEEYCPGIMKYMSEIYYMLSTLFVITNPLAE